MQEIKCPKCGEIFQIDETGYSELLKQVRSDEFNREIASIRERSEQEARVIREQCELEKEKSLLEVRDAERKHAEKIRQSAAEAKAKYELELNRLAAEKDAKIGELTASLKQSALEAELKMKDATAERDSEIQKLKGELREEQVKREQAIILKNEEIEMYKNMKAKLSTKMVGESLEEHCRNEFESLRQTGFKEAYFEKDNDARSGSKGDFIFRDYSDGTEYVSIMFEMKNENETTQTKKKNEDFFKELDKDRREKNCEYAVLVSLLESESELYNQGIVDVSHRYEKMYVVRPQFFIPIITLIRNAALNSLQYKKELAIVKAQNIDVENFEDELLAFKDSFGRNFRIASEKFDEAVKEIDKTIDHLTKVKEALIGSKNQLRLANDKAEDLSIKKLTKKNPTMQREFARIAAKKQNIVIDED